MRQRQRGFGLGAGNCGEMTRKYTGKLMKDKGCLVGLFALFHPGMDSLFLVIRMFSSSWYKERNFFTGTLMPCF